MNHKIIFLVAPPRSLSTAFVRMMDARGDFSILNEPACSIFNTKHYPQTKHIYNDNALTDYPEVTKKINHSAQSSPVFIKEMSFAFEEYINTEPALLKNPNVHFVFLLRNPHACIISYYRKMDTKFIEYTLPHLKSLIGFDALERSYQLIQKYARNKPTIIHAEKLSSDTETTIKNFCNQVAITYPKECLIWGDLAASSDGSNWMETKKPEYSQHWHGTALISNQFNKLAHYATDDHDNPTFVEIKNPRHREHCFSTYDACKALYALFID